MTRAPSPEPDAPEQRRTLETLVIAQVLSGAGLAAGVTVGALLAAQMLGTTRAAGLPTTSFTLGSALAAVAVGHVSQHRGRRAGLVLGYAAGAVGAFGVVLAAVAGSVPALFVSLFVYGAGFATNLQARYAGADLAAPSRRGRAVSIVLVATTLGAVAGPNLVTVTGEVVAPWGIPALAGPFLLAALAFGSAALVLWLRLRPDPLLLARARATSGEVTPTPDPAAPTPDPAAPTPDPAAPTPARPATTQHGPRAIRARSRDPVPHRPPGLAVGAAAMSVATVVMVSIMTMTPVHMSDSGHSLSAAGAVIAVHVGFMFLPSPLSGWLVDRYGPRVVAVLSALTLLAAGLVAAGAPASSVVVLGTGLALLGLGWSLGLVSGTAIVAAAVPLERRASVQGNVDVLLALAGAAGGALSGLVVAGSGYGVLALGAAVLALALGASVLADAVRSGAGARPASRTR